MKYLQYRHCCHFPNPHDQDAKLVHPIGCPHPHCMNDGIDV